MYITITYLHAAAIDNPTLKTSKFIVREKCHCTYIILKQCYHCVSIDRYYNESIIYSGLDGKEKKINTCVSMPIRFKTI